MDETARWSFLPGKDKQKFFVCIFGREFSLFCHFLKVSKVSHLWSSLMYFLTFGNFRAQFHLTIICCLCVVVQLRVRRYPVRYRQRQLLRNFCLLSTDCVRKCVKRRDFFIDGPEKTWRNLSNQNVKPEPTRTSHPT